MLRNSLVFVLLLTAGCTSLHKDYVEADAAAWAPFDKDNRLDTWIDSSQLDPGVKDALHKLNLGRRARVSHALAEVTSGS